LTFDRDGFFVFLKVNFTEIQSLQRFNVMHRAYSYQIMSNFDH